MDMFSKKLMTYADPKDLDVHMEDLTQFPLESQGFGGYAQTYHNVRRWFQENDAIISKLPDEYLDLFAHVFIEKQFPDIKLNDEVNRESDE